MPLYRGPCSVFLVLQWPYSSFLVVSAVTTGPELLCGYLNAESGRWRVGWHHECWYLLRCQIHKWKQRVRIVQILVASIFHLDRLLL